MPLSTLLGDYDAVDPTELADAEADAYWRGEYRETVLGLPARPGVRRG